MSSRIETIDDLIKVSSTAAAELIKPIKPKKPKPSKPTKSPKVPKKPKPTKRIDRSCVSMIPTHLDLEGLKNIPMEVRGYHKEMTREQIVKKIKEALVREKKFSKIYQNSIANNENNYGYLIVSINIKREAEMLKNYLEELDHED